MDIYIFIISRGIYELHTCDISNGIFVSVDPDSKRIYGKYYEYTTLYRKIDGGYILSNDGSIYVEPDPEILTSSKEFSL